LGLIRFEFELGRDKIELMVEILRSKTVQNKPKRSIRARRDPFRIILLRTEQANRDQMSDV